MPTSLCRLLLAASLFLALGTAGRAQVNIIDVEVQSGDFILGDQAVNYSFTLQGARTGATQAEAEVKPYYYIIYAEGQDIYGNPFYQQLAQGLSNTLYGAITGEGSQPATEQTLEGTWSSADVTLLNYFPLRLSVQKRQAFHRIVLVLYGDGITPGTAPPDDAAFLAPAISRSAGQIYFYTESGPDFQMQEVTYNAGTYEGGDIIRMTTRWRNLVFPIGPNDVTYKVHSYLTDNASVDWRPPTDLNNPPDAVVPDNDDFLLSEFTVVGDRPVQSPVDTTPITPDASSVVRQIEVVDTPNLLPTYGIVNTTVAPGPSYYESTLRIYQPQPDDGWMDVGETVSVTTEVKVPQNYAGQYFVAARVDPENTVPEPTNLLYLGSNLRLEITDGQPDNNTFVSNASAKITVNGPTDAPTVEAVSSVSYQDGQYVQGGGETSGQSSVSSDGNLIAFASAARNLLVPPPLAEAFISEEGRGADMVSFPLFSNDGLRIGDYLTTGQQIFLRLRQTRENYLVSGVAGEWANADCFNPAISSDGGQFVAFDSRASNLGTQNTGNRSFVYLANTGTQLISTASVNAAGEPANGDSFDPSLSATGRFVAFQSSATNLDASRPIPGGNTAQQIYLHDRDVNGNGTFDEPGDIATYLVSVSDVTGEPAIQQCLMPAVSANITATPDGNVVYVAYVSFDNMGNNGVSGSQLVYRAAVRVSGGTPGFVSGSVRLVSANDDGEPARKVQGAPNNSIEPSISADGSQIAFTSSADNLVRNPIDGTWVPTFPDPADPFVRPAGDYNRVPDVFVRDLTNSRTIRVSESIPRVATGTISFVSPSLLFPAPNNLPQNNPADGDRIEVWYPSVPNGPLVLQQTFEFASAPAPVSEVEIGPEVDLAVPEPVLVVTGQDVQTTRDNLVDAINSSGLDLVASATTPPSAPPGMAYNASIYVRSLIPGEDGNGLIRFIPAAPPAPGERAVVQTTNLTGGGEQAEDAVAAVQGVPAGSNQPSISSDGRLVSFRSIAGNLDVQQLTPENDFEGGPPYNDLYPPSPRQGELIRPDRFPASNVYVHNRQVDPSITGFDQPENISTTKVSFNNFGYPTTVSAQQSAGLGAFTTAANQQPSISGNGRFISFSSGSFAYGGLAFGRNNLEPLDFQDARDVYLYDAQIVGIAPPPTESRPEITITSPQNGLRVPVGTGLAISANAIPKLGKTIASVQFYINGSPVGAPLTAEPYAVTQSFNNPGQYIIRAVATDSRGITSAASVTITVAPPVGEPPTVVLNSPVSDNSNLVVGSVVDVSALATDPEGILPGSVQFFLSGSPLPGVVQRFDNNYTTQLRISKTGSYTLTAQATDTDGNTTVSQIKTINVVSAADAFPVVEVLPIQDGTPIIAGGVIPLQARATFFSSQITESFVWFYADGIYIGQGNVQPDGTFLLNWQLPSTPRAYARVTASLVGVNRVVSIGAEESIDYFAIVPSRNFITINTIAGTPPSVSLTTPTTGTSVPVGTGVLLQATATVPAGQGTIERVEFYQNGAQIGVADTTAPYSVTFNPPSAGQYSLVAVAYSTAGLVASSAPVTIGATQGAPPIVDLTVTGTLGASLVTVDEPVLTPTILGPNIVFSYLAKDGVVYLLQAKSALTDPTWTAYAAPITVSPDQTGVPDGFTRVQFSAPIAGPMKFFRVVYPPTIGTDKESLVNENVTLAANATDADGSIVRVEFLVNGVVVSTVTGSPFNFVLPFTSPGRYEVIARATDNVGNVTDSAPTFVTVTNGNLPEVTITSPSDGDVLTPGNPVTVTVSALDRDGSLTQVELLVNGEVVGTDTQAPYVFTDAGQFSSGTNTSFTPASEGRYVLIARATDNLGNVRNSVAVTTTARTPADASLVPRVRITQPLGEVYYVDGSSLFLNAEATDAPPGQIVPSSVAFTVNGLSLPGATVGRIGDNYGVRYTPNNLFGIDAIRAQATDNDGNTSFSQLNYTVLTLPLSPLPAVRMLPLLPGAPLDAGGVITLRAEAFFPNTGGDVDPRVEFFANNVYLGAGTVDPDDPTLYTFEWLSPETPAAYAIQARAVALNFRTNVGEGNSIDYFGSVISPNSVGVNTIEGAVPNVSITSPINGQNVIVNQPFTISSTASTTTGMTIDRVEFYANGLLLGSDATFPYTVNFTPPSLGLYTITAWAYSSAGILGTSDPVVVSSTTGGVPVFDFFDVPAQGLVGSTAVIQAQVSDPDGAITSVEFLVNGVVVFTDNAAPYIYEMPLPNAGLYTVQARATDNSGNIALSEAKELIALFGTLPSITITTPPDGTTALPGSPIPIEAIASGGSGSIASVTFYVNGTLLSTFTAAPFRTAFTPQADGQYTIRAVVLTSYSAQAEDTNIVTVGAPPPGSTGAFVFEMYDKLLDTFPTQQEYNFYVQQLDLNQTNPNLGLTRSEFVAELIYSTRYLNLQNRILDSYYRLGVTPVAQTFQTQEDFLELNPGTLLPLTTYPPYTTNPTPPFGATTSQATVAQQIINSPAFQTLFPSIPSSNNQDFLTWFYPRLGGQYGDVSLVLNMMETYAPATDAKGSAVSFLTAAYQNIGNLNSGAAAAQEAYQYQLRATSVQWLLGGPWVAPTSPTVQTYPQLIQFLNTILPPP